MHPDPPICRAVAHDLGFHGRHHWRTEPRDTAPDATPDTEETPVSRHGDHDNDGVPNHADPDWTGEDERDLWALGDDGCDQPQQQPERWVGVQRDPDLLPVGADTTTSDDDWRDPYRGGPRG